MARTKTIKVWHPDQNTAWRKVQDILDGADAAAISSRDVTKAYYVLGVTHEENQKPYTYTVVLSQPPEQPSESKPWWKFWL
jgi:hypothetical protein